ncbi:permease [Nitratireductor sp. XY-223]|uniref:permease n=1 Tax=Nitratireductor sp. XY-223 TaxID=2561926 RepID=UPI0010A9C414|nr:permease [Nitratireductor sp. XY-223]
MSSASFAWFARHEIGLFWRDWTALVLRGKPHRRIFVGLAIAGFIIGMHVVAWFTVTDTVDLAATDPRAVFIFVSGCALVSLSLMVSQSLEMVTRAFYARADLDLILTSPAPSARIFIVRFCAVALMSVVMSAALAAPFFNVMAFLEGPVWLLSYFALLSMSAIATAIAIVVAVALFATVGPRRTRVIAQIIAAVIGAGFAIAMQLVAIVYFGNVSRLSVLTSPELTGSLPPVASPLWIPARALLGDISAVLAFCIAGFGILALSIAAFSSRFATLALSTVGVSEQSAANSARPARFRAGTVRRTLRRKELVLLARDPWLLSQTLMQMLYLLVPAFLLWRNYGTDIGAVIVVVPVVVMASGQLAGGLAWLTLCGEDAPDLVQSAPMSPHIALQAKIEAVLIAVGLAVSPIVAFLGLVDLRAAAITAGCMVLSASAATAMQVWFRAQARRSHFRHRHASSKIATLAEAFSSICWAGTAAFLALGNWLAAIPAAMAILVLVFVWMIRPREA